MLNNQGVNWHLALLCAATVGCKTISNSSTKDIGFVNTANASAKVLYSDGSQVFLKSCKPPLPAPLTRDCPSDESAKSMALDDYMNKLPYDSSPYTRNDQGLAIVTKALSDAQAAASGGHAQAQAAVTRLTPIKSNLEKLAQIRADLMPAQKDLTYYEWREEFSKLLAPFGAVGGSATVIAMNFIPVQGQSFSMQETEVTRGQWKALMGYYPEANDQSCDADVLTDDQPVSCVSAYDAERFADEMTRKNDGHTYRLPSVQERAAAAGNIEGPVYGWCNGKSTQPVKRLKAQNGLYDMVGNVHEWTSSNWDSSSSDRVIRGGSWRSDPRFCKASGGGSMPPDNRSDFVGFRLLRQP